MCKHPKECTVQDEDGDESCRWCDEITWYKTENARLRIAVHGKAVIVQDGGVCNVTGPIDYLEVRSGGSVTCRK